MTLRQARVVFSRLLVNFCIWLGDQGQEYAFDEGTNHQQTGHMPGSLHYFGCAIDILFYDKEGHYLIDTKDYEEAGKKWKSFGTYCRWGGDFSNPDGNHFSFSPPELFNGRA